MAPQQRPRFLALRMLAALIVALLLGSLLAACGSDDEDEEAPVNHFDQSELSQGQQAPDFTLPTAAGRTVSLDDYTSAGQPVMLFFHMAGG